jgi:aspartate/methionine/tyrosine aminotransferase
MSNRLTNIPGFSIDRVAAAAGNDPEILRLENLDTDLPPPYAAIEATRAALSNDNANSYLPFTGSTDLRAVVAQHLNRQTGVEYSADQIVITAGGTEGMYDAILAITDPADEVIVTDPTYAGMIYRIGLAGAVAVFVPFVVINNEWRLDVEALRSAITNRTRAIFLMNPSMPSGAVLNIDEWKAVIELCQARNLWLLYNAAMERILYDGRCPIHPAAFSSMSSRTIIVGSLSKEYRMIGWRIGWVAAPSELIGDIARIHIYNVVTPPGISQPGAVAALQSPAKEFTDCVAEWQRRRDTVLDQLRDYALIPPAGGWSLLWNITSLNMDSTTASNRLLEFAKVAATPMKNWGMKNSDQFVRLVFSNETVQRLSTLRDRVRRAF